MEFDVTVDRNKYIGGSDVPVIMGISPFKKRFDLLLEKAGLKENDFSGNQYTEYGNILEPQIRDYINKQMPKSAQFIPDQTIKGDIRAHTDGFNGYCVLEIKTTSHIYETVAEYKIYLVQLLLYMQVKGVKSGLLAVYKRPEDFNTDFNPENLSIFEVDIEDYDLLVADINSEIERFRADLKRLEENPLLSEDDFLPNEVITVSNKVAALEKRMAEFKTIEAEYKAMKQALFEAMQKYDIKSWETYNGTKITRVDGSAEKIETVMEFDAEKFKADNPEMYDTYCKAVEKKTKGRAGYVKITLPK